MKNLDIEESNQIENVKRIVESKVRENIQTSWKDKYQEAINMLVDNGRNYEDAQNGAFEFFVNKMTEPQERKIHEEMSELKSAVEESIKTIMEKVNEVETQISALDNQ